MGILLRAALLFYVLTETYGTLNSDSAVWTIEESLYTDDKYIETQSLRVFQNCFTCTHYSIEHFEKITLKRQEKLPAGSKSV